MDLAIVRNEIFCTRFEVMKIYTMFSITESRYKSVLKGRLLMSPWGCVPTPPPVTFSLPSQLWHQERTRGQTQFCPLFWSLGSHWFIPPHDCCTPTLLFSISSVSADLIQIIRVQIFYYFLVIILSPWAAFFWTLVNRSWQKVQCTSAVLDFLLHIV